MVMDAEDLSPSERRALAIFTKMQIRILESKVRDFKEQLNNLATYGIDINDLPDYGWISRVDAKEAEDVPE